MDHEPNLPEELHGAVRVVVCDGLLVVGDYEITSVSEGKVYINHTSGEGGQFSAEAFAAHVKKFFDENF